MRYLNILFSNSPTFCTLFMDKLYLRSIRATSAAITQTVRRGVHRVAHAPRPKCLLTLPAELSLRQESRA